MKKLFIALAFATLSAVSAQDVPTPQKGRMEKLTPEQRNQLQLKKMTLDLGLNDSQQKEMAKVIADQSAKREAASANIKANREKGIKPTAAERYSKQNQLLDDQIAVKDRVKKILTRDQFEKWEQMRQERMAKHGKHHAKRRNPENGPN